MVHGTVQDQINCFKYIIIFYDFPFKTKSGQKQNTLTVDTMKRYNSC